jgi:hypothetical protein
MNLSKSRKVFPTDCCVIQALVPAKRPQRIFSSMLAGVIALFPVSNAQAKKKTDDWQAVQNLKPGTRVIVKAQRNYACAAEGATEDELVCEVHRPRSFGSITVKIPRAEIREVRALPNQAKDAWIGAGIGGAAGAVAAGTNSRDYPGFHAFIGGLAGAGAGALVGATVPIFEYLIQHGKIIYKR